MKTLLNSRGVTLVEVIASLAIVMASVAVLMHLALSGRLHKTQVDRTLVFKEVLTNNAIEIKSKTIETLPAPGKCIVRYYDTKINFLNETTVQGSSPACNTPPPEEGTIQVVWEIQAGSTIEANFSSPNLSLPKYSNNLKKVILHVRGFVTQGSGGRLVHNQVTLFKR